MATRFATHLFTCLSTAVALSAGGPHAAGAQQAPDTVFVRSVAPALHGAERVDSLVAFTGSAFWLADGGTPLLRITRPARVLMPRVAWQFSDSTASVDAIGMLQGAALQIGRGRIVAAGEVAMFSPQRSGSQGAGRMGFNDPTAPQNAQFVLNVLHWPSGALPVR